MKGSTDLEVPACAAILVFGGGVDLVVSGHRHSDCLTQLNWWGIKHKVETTVSGFMTTRGRFVPRKEALRLMEMAERESAAKGGYRKQHGLFSEDLY